MTTRYWVETECEDCGLTHPKGARGVRIGDEWRVLCDGPGGQRRELTGVEVVEASQTDEWLAHDYALPVPNPGRYLIIPLEKPDS